jgi:urease accessory protein
VDRAGTALRPLTRDLRGADAVGRHARLDLVFGERRGRTVLLHEYVEPPLRIGRCLETADGLLVILASSAPGVFGGDCVEQSIRVESGARVRLVSQSALQIHPVVSGRPAQMVSRYDVEQGATLDCWWDPLIPFARASFEQRVGISIAPGGRLSWSDSCMSGRVARGERWAFARLACELRVCHAGGLGYLERYAIEPAATTPLSRWTADGSEYFGTTFRIGHGDRPERAETLHRLLQGDRDLSAAADLLDDDLLMVRLAARSGVSFHRARAAVASTFGVPVQKR